MMKSKIRTVSLALALFLTGSAAAYFGTAPIFKSIYSQTKIQAMWKEHFPTLERLRDGVEAVVVARVVDIAPGRVVGDIDNPEVEFTNVILEVRSSVRGQAPDQIVLEVTGNLLGERRVVFLQTPDYEIGENYLLFLNRSEEADSWYVVNNQGGYRISVSDNQEAFVRAADPGDEVAGELDGMELGAAIARLHGRSGHQPNNPRSFKR